METKKVLSLIFSIIFVCAFGYVLSWGIINFNKVKDGMSGTELYTKEDLNNAYNDGYDTALEDKDEYTELINGYRDTITTLNDNISQLNSQINILANNNKDYANQVTNLESQKSNLQEQVNNLTTIKSDNEKTIASLSNQISNLNLQITDLNNTIQVNETTINGLNSQIVGLNTQIVSLNQTITNNEKTIADLRIDINELNDKIVNLSGDKQENQTLITKLNNEIIFLNEQITSLEEINNNYVKSIDSLEKEITTLTKEKDNLIVENANYSNTISSLNNQIINLQNVNTQLEATINLHLNTISSLNSQIAVLNNQINDMTMQIQNNSANVTALNNKIAELEKSVSYYEQYIANLENGEQVVATFEFDGSVYNIQVVNKNNTVSVVNPTSTDYIIFNYWTVGGERIDLSTYKITTNTKIVADVTYRYDVIYKVDDTTYNSQIVTSNNYPTLPSNPTKAGYEFDGWTLNGSDIVNPNTTAITQNTTYVAKFIKLHTVTFLVDDEVYNTQSVVVGGYVTKFDNPVLDGAVFIGWSLTNNSDILNLNSFQITEDVVLYAYFIADYSGRTATLSFDGDSDGISEEVGVVEVIDNDVYIKLKFGFLLNNFKLTLQFSTALTGWIGGYTYTWRIKAMDVLFEKNYINFTQTGATNYGSFSGYFDDNHCVVLKLTLSEPNAIISEAEIIGGYYYTSYCGLYGAKGDSDLSSYGSYVPSDVSLLTNLYSNPSSFDFIMIYDFSDIFTIPEGYKVELYFTRDSGIKGASYDDLEYIGIVGEVSTISIPFLGSDNVYIIARYIAL